MHVRAAVLLAAVAIVLPGCSEAPSRFYVSYRGQRPPALEGEGVEWLNHEPVAWEDLKGKVVLLGFSFLR